MTELHVDRAALREIVNQLQASAAADDWCVACGAGRGSAKLDMPLELVNEAGRQLLDPAALRTFVDGVREIGGEQAWCVACGAGKGASPIDERVNPADLADPVIDDIAKKLLGVVRIGK